MKTYAAYYDNKIRMDSSSGGLFSVIASYFDVVYGVAMTDDCRDAEFRRIDNGNIAPLRGSKYIQAKVGETFLQVKQDLVDGKEVLFTGTACQINGLRCFLQKEYQNFTTVDVICHGAPTAKYWQKYIEDKNVSRVNFRAKDGGWTGYTYGMKLNDTYIPYDRNDFMSLYVKDYAIRPSCYKCICKSNKLSDITLGDFWGIENIASEMDDNKGTSVVIVRTEKGQNLFEAIKPKLKYKEVCYEDGVRQNPSEYSSSKKPDYREQFFRDLEVISFDELYKKYVPQVPLWRRVARKAKRLIKKPLGK